MFVVSCSVNDSDSERNTECILQQIQFDEFNSLNFKTISGGRIYNLNQEFTLEGETKTVASFLFKYFADSIAVQDQNDPFSILPFLSVKLNDDKPIRVVKFFSNAGVKLIHELDYFSNNLIRIDLFREASDGGILYVGYSNYHLNEDGNVFRNERFSADRSDTTQFSKFEDRFYTYDNYSNPQKNLYLPFFADTNFPDVKFFSANNILSFTEEDQTFQFEYEYGTNENIVSQTLPDGQSIFFRYVNCP